MRIEELEAALRRAAAAQPPVSPDARRAVYRRARVHRRWVAGVGVAIAAVLVAGTVLVRLPGEDATKVATAPAMRDCGFYELVDLIAVADADGQRAQQCLAEAFHHGAPATMTVTVPTVEGDPIRYGFEVKAPRSVEIIKDATADRFGSETTTTFTCRTLEAGPRLPRFDDCSPPRGEEKAGASCQRPVAQAPTPGGRERRRPPTLVVRYRVAGPSGPLEGNEWELPVHPDRAARLTIEATVQEGVRVNALRIFLKPAEAPSGPPYTATLDELRELGPGTHRFAVEWDGRDDSGRRVALGRYRLYGGVKGVHTHDDCGAPAAADATFSEGAGLGVMRVESG